MARIRISPRLSRLSLFLLYATVQATDLFSRQDAVCGGRDNLAQCGSDFPSEICCPKDSTCKRLNSPADVVSVICCPAGSECNFIQPITCNVAELDSKLHPDNQIHLVSPQAIELPKCGSQCCPLGYSCVGTLCKADPVAPSPTPSPSPTIPPTTTPSASATQAPTETKTTQAAAEPVIRTERGFDGKSFVAGFFPGIVMGGLGTIGLIWIIKKRRESQEKNRFSGDFGHVSHKISDPIYDPEHAARTDFIRRGSRSAQPSPDSFGWMKEATTQPQTGMTPRLKSLWERTPKLGFGGFGGSGQSLPADPRPVPPAIRAGQGRDPYKTPNRTPETFRSFSISRTPSIHIQKTLQRPVAQRGNSAETIDVVMRTPSLLAPPQAPGMRNNENRLTTDSGQTTFTKLMERAGYDRNSREEVRGWKESPERR